MANRTFGGNADFYIDDTWIEDQLNSITMNADVPSSDITAFDSTYGTAVAGKKNITYELAGSLDEASGEAAEVIFECIGAGVKTSKFEPAGATTCYYNCTGSGLVGTFVTRYSISLPVGDAASFTASLQNSGLTERKTS